MARQSNLIVSRLKRQMILLLNHSFRANPLALSPRQVKLDSNKRQL